jgi:tRNA G46 methylase TrmB
MEEKGGQSRSPNRSESSLASSTQIYAANIKKLTDDFESIVKMTTSELEVEQRRVDEERKALQREKEKFEKDRRDAEEIFGRLEDIVEINCGGQVFATYRSTLMKAPGSCFLLADLMFFFFEVGFGRSKFFSFLASMFSPFVFLGPRRNHITRPNP